MRDEIDDAIKHIKKPISTKNDAFLVLSSLNLLNAAVKKEEYKDLLGYGLIKPSVSKFMQFCIENQDCDFVEEIYYDTKGQCIYIRCFGIQFSFHNIGIHHLCEEFINSSQNKRVEWGGIKLQPIALDLYQLAIECVKNNICDTKIVKEKFQVILDSVSEKSA